MVSTTFLRFSGAALCLSGFLYIADTALDVLAPAASPGLGALVPVLGLVGFPGLWLWLSGGRESWLDRLAYLFGMLGLAGLVIVAFLNNRLFPDLPRDMLPQLIGAIRLELLMIGVIFLVSALLLLPLGWRGGRVSRAAGICYAAGAVPVSLPPLMPAGLVTAGGLTVAAALLLWGANLLICRAERPDRAANP